MRGSQREFAFIWWYETMELPVTNPNSLAAMLKVRVKASTRGPNGDFAACMKFQYISEMRRFTEIIALGKICLKFFLEGSRTKAEGKKTRKRFQIKSFSHTDTLNNAV